MSIAVAPCGSLAGSAARPLWWVNVGLGLGIVALSLVSTSGRARRSAQRLAPLIAR